VLEAARSFLVPAALLAASAAQAATWTVPGLSNAPGRNKTFFASELKVRNPGAAAAEVTFDLLPVVGPGGPAATRTVGAGETLVLPNALQELWGPGDRAGAVRVTSSQDLLFSARTYNAADPTGTFGLGLEAVREEELLAEGQTGHVGWVSESPDPAAGFRTNVGVVLPAAGSSVDVVVFGGSGTELGRRTFSGGPLATQVSVREIAGGDLAVARLELRVTAGKATGYAAVVDNVTGDGFTVAPRRITLGRWTDVFLNGASRGEGRFETFYRTDVRLVNPEGTPRTVTVSGVSLVAGGQGFPASATVQVPARAVREIVDVLGTLLLAPDGTSGSLRFETDGPLLVLGRTSNVRPDGATFGALQRTSEADEFLRFGRSGTFVGLLQSATAPGYRTNVGFLAGHAGALVDLTLRDRAGTVVATRPGALSLGSRAFWQPPLSDLFPGTTVPEQATLEVTPTEGTVDVYASFIDNGTGDPVIYPFAEPAFTLPANFSETSPCAPNPGAAGLVNPGTVLSRVDVDLARYPDAVCNDGTPGVFYVRRGTGAGLNRWIVFLEGGGSCSSADACAKRWCSIETNFGAAKMSNRWAPAGGVAGGGILSTREDSAFRDFSKVWVYYCSSDVWSGRSGNRPLVDSTGRVYTIHMQGARILDAVVSELRSGITYTDAGTGAAVTLPSLDDAEAVLFVGESGGSAGVQRNADRLGPLLERTNRNPGGLFYRALGDAANTPSNEALPTYEEDMRAAFRSSAALYSGRVDESCLESHPADTWRCGDPVHVREHHLTTPIFFRQDLLDPNTLDNLGTPEWDFGTQVFEFGQFTWDHLDRVSRARTTAEEKDAMTVDPGVYGPHCDEHTALRNNGKFFDDKVAFGGALLSYHDTFRNWLLGNGPTVVLEPRPTGDPVPGSAVCSP